LGNLLITKRKLRLVYLPNETRDCLSNFSALKFPFLICSIAALANFCLTSGGGLLLGLSTFISKTTRKRELTPTLAFLNVIKEKNQIVQNYANDADDNM
jgi:hypothetical protein